MKLQVTECLPNTINKKNFSYLAIFHSVYYDFFQKPQARRRVDFIHKYLNIGGEDHHP